jgi:nucleoside-diphosphate-sugar epimerase
VCSSDLIVNIANEEEWTIGDLALKIKEVTASESEIIRIDAPKKRYDYEVERRVGCSEKLYAITDYKPTTSLHEGLNHINSSNSLKKTLKHV